MRPDRVLGVIPARMGASRFPGKPLAPLCGRPMLQHVFERASRSPELDDLVIATCDPQIRDAGASFGARVIMTSPRHERATDRVAEAAAGEDSDIILMIQGDEPMIVPGMIGAALAPLRRNQTLACVNLMASIRSEEELNDPNTIKVAVTDSGDALYFSRSPIPYRTTLLGDGWYKQVCVIGFRRWALQQFNAWPQGRLEAAESVDMLRFLENGVAVRMVLSQVPTQAVDTADDLARVQRLMQQEQARTDGMLT